MEQVLPTRNSEPGDRTASPKTRLAETAIIIEKREVTRKHGYDYQACYLHGLARGYHLKAAILMPDRRSKERAS